MYNACLLNRFFSRHVSVSLSNHCLLFSLCARNRSTLLMIQPQTDWWVRECIAAIACVLSLQTTQVYSRRIPHAGHNHKCRDYKTVLLAPNRFCAHQIYPWTKQSTFENQNLKKRQCKTWPIWKQLFWKEKSEKGATIWKWWFWKGNIWIWTFLNR